MGLLELVSARIKAAYVWIFPDLACKMQDSHGVLLQRESRGMGIDYLGIVGLYLNM